MPNELTRKENAHYAKLYEEFIKKYNLQGTRIAEILNPNYMLGHPGMTYRGAPLTATIADIERLAQSLGWNGALGQQQPQATQPQGGGIPALGGLPQPAPEPAFNFEGLGIEADKNAQPAKYYNKLTPEQQKKVDAAATEIQKNNPRKPGESSAEYKARMDPLIKQAANAIINGQEQNTPRATTQPQSEEIEQGPQPWTPLQNLKNFLWQLIKLNPRKENESSKAYANRLNKIVNDRPDLKELLKATTGNAKNISDKDVDEMENNIRTGNNLPPLAQRASRQSADKSGKEEINKPDEATQKKASEEVEIMGEQNAAQRRSRADILASLSRARPKNMGEYNAMVDALTPEEREIALSWNKGKNAGEGGNPPIGNPQRFSDERKTHQAREDGLFWKATGYLATPSEHQWAEDNTPDGLAAKKKIEDDLRHEHDVEKKKKMKKGLREFFLGKEEEFKEFPIGSPEQRALIKETVQAARGILKKLAPTQTGPAPQTNQNLSLDERLAAAQDKYNNRTKPGEAEPVIGGMPSSDIKVPEPIEIPQQAQGNAQQPGPIPYRKPDGSLGARNPFTGQEMYVGTGANNQPVAIDPQTGNQIPLNMAQVQPGQQSYGLPGMGSYQAPIGQPQQQNGFQTPVQQAQAVQNPIPQQAVPQPQAQAQPAAQQPMDEANQRVLLDRLRNFTGAEARRPWEALNPQEQQEVNNLYRNISQISNPIRPLVPVLRQAEFLYPNLIQANAQQQPPLANAYPVQQPGAQGFVLPNAQQQTQQGGIGGFFDQTRNVLNNVGGVTQGVGGTVGAGSDFINRLKQIGPMLEQAEGPAAKIQAFTNWLGTVGQGASDATRPIQQTAQGVSNLFTNPTGPNGGGGPGGPGGNGGGPYGPMPIWGVPMPYAENQYLRQFYEQTVPTLAERFTALGGGAQRSSAFRGALGQAGGNLALDLAAQRERYNQQQQAQQLQQQQLAEQQRQYNLNFRGQQQQQFFNNQLTNQTQQANLFGGLSQLGQQPMSETLHRPSTEAPFANILGGLGKATAAGVGALAGNPQALQGMFRQ